MPPSPPPPLLLLLLVVVVEEEEEDDGGAEHSSSTHSLRSLAPAKQRQRRKSLSLSLSPGERASSAKAVSSPNLRPLPRARRNSVSGHGGGGLGSPRSLQHRSSTTRGSVSRTHKFEYGRPTTLKEEFEVMQQDFRIKKEQVKQRIKRKQGELRAAFEKHAALWRDTIFIEELCEMLH
mmetsp:Transcript_32546/g.63721  ORF Transcript_32546/g.63721 Transcript_32546/m.63721 type:complete len:178 (-) Transcript_32546:317-850(-)